MSLDNIQLTPFLIQELYNNSLFDLDTNQTNPLNEDQKKIRYLGMNKKNIVVLVDNHESIFLPEKLFDFLLGILTACMLSLDDVVLINTDKNPGINYKQLEANFAPDRILLFGIDPASLQFPLVFPYYQLQKYNNQVYLYAPSLQTLSDDKTQKTHLWISLKKLFALNAK